MFIVLRVLLFLTLQTLDSTEDTASNGVGIKIEDSEKTQIRGIQMSQSIVELEEITETERSEASEEFENKDENVLNEYVVELGASVGHQAQG